MAKAKVGKRTVKNRTDNEAIWNKILLTNISAEKGGLP